MYLDTGILNGHLNAHHRAFDNIRMDFEELLLAVPHKNHDDLVEMFEGALFIEMKPQVDSLGEYLTEEATLHDDDVADLEEAVSSLRTALDEKTKALSEAKATEDGLRAEIMSLKEEIELAKLITYGAFA